MVSHLEPDRAFPAADDATARLRFRADGRLVSASAAAARLFGFESTRALIDAAERGELANLHFPDREWLRQVLSAGEVVVEDRVLHRRVGAAFPCRIFAGPWCREDRAAGVEAVLEDRTSMQDVRDFLSAIMDALPNPVFVKDSAHRWIALNEAYCELSNSTPQERLGKSDYDFHPPEEADVFWERDDIVLATGTIDENEEPWTDDTGQVHTFITRKSRHIVDGQPFLVGVITDITERKRAEEALRRSSEDLERRVHERTAELQRANEVLELLHRRRGEFISVLSHELRNPLAPICNGLYLLSHNKSLDEPARYAISVIERQVGHLKRIVTDLLDVTRVSHGKTRLQRSRLDFADLLRQTLDDLRHLLARHELIAEIPARRIWVDGDPTRLVQIVVDLLENAAKFTPEGERIWVTLRETDRRVVLEVADAGVGIDADTLSRIFEPFAQASQSLDRSRGGLGLGLTLVKGLVTLHGGTIEAESEGNGHGARFTVTLPSSAPERAEASDPQRANHKNAVDNHSSRET